VSYARLDDLLPHRRPILDAAKQGPCLLGWHLAAHCYAERHRTDGLIPRHGLALLIPGAGRPSRKVLDQLRTSGLWAPVDDGGWRLVDYHEHNDPVAVRVERGRKAARVRWDAPRKLDASDSDAVRMPDASASHACLDATPPSLPRPVTPPSLPRSAVGPGGNGDAPAPSTGSETGRSRDRNGVEEEVPRRGQVCKFEWLGGPRCPREGEHNRRDRRRRESDPTRAGDLAAALISRARPLTGLQA
jgi:hypothetical protein